MAEENDNTGKLVWFFAGAAIGAAIALLCAPYTGKELRRRLGEKAGEGRDKLKEASRDVLDRGRELYEKGRKVADDAAELFDKGRKLVQG